MFNNSVLRKPASLPLRRHIYNAHEASPVYRIRQENVSVIASIAFEGLRPS